MRFFHYLSNLTYKVVNKQVVFLIENFPNLSRQKILLYYLTVTHNFKYYIGSILFKHNKKHKYEEIVSLLRNWCKLYFLNIWEGIFGKFFGWNHEVFRSIPRSLLLVIFISRKVSVIFKRKYISCFWLFSLFL